jgi:KaiC/GvpD/RAD55 family RecA-like ATPase
MQIPGIADLIEKGTIPESLLLLTGPAGSGKSIYCKQFFSDGLIDGDYCIYVSSSLTDRQFRKQFPNVEKLILVQNSKFINPYLYPISPPSPTSSSSSSSSLSSLSTQDQYSSQSSSSSSSSLSSSPYSFSVSRRVSDNNYDNNNIANNSFANNERKMTENQSLATKLSLTLRDIQECIARVKFAEQNYHDDNSVRSTGVGDTYISRSTKDSSSFDGISDSQNTDLYPSSSRPPSSSFTSHFDEGKTGTRSVRIVLDSLTHLFAVFGENAVLKFINDLSFILKEADAMAIFTLTSPSMNPHLTNTLSSFFDGVIEIKVEENNGFLSRNIRLLSIKGIYHNPAWINFKISDDGSLAFGDQASPLTCMLCGKTILGTPILDSDYMFDSQVCLETYKKLAGVYGHNISEIGLPSEVVDMNFFYTDIVSLSDPSLPVKKQMEKIGSLNRMIGSCDAFKSKDRRITLPTGDGMAIGYLSNPELPFQLSIQLHKKLRIYNRGKSKEDVIGVRIGLSSGPVFVVTDIRDNQNVWGPGIILARRVMDIGDNNHILLDDRLAEELIALKDEYRLAIRPIVDYKIKHGQTIKLYTAFSKEFGSPKPPTKIVEHYY